MHPLKPPLPRNALITGGAGGLGRAIARRLNAMGITCLLVDIDAERLDAAVGELGPLCIGHVADITCETAIKQLVDRVTTLFGRLDLLVNNAGVISTEAFESRTATSVKRELEANLLAPIAITHAMLPSLQGSGRGRVVSIVSLGGIFPLPETCVYSAAKFGLRGAMLCLGLDGPRLGVQFSIVNPSATETAMLVHEALNGGNKLQFMDPPQMPDDVAQRVIDCLSSTSIETFVRPSESWTVRMGMLMPNLLGRILPCLRKSAERGHLRYMQSLSERGIIRREGERWVLANTRIIGQKFPRG